MKLKRIFVCLLFILGIYSQGILAKKYNIIGPWLTGPLLALNGQVVPVGHMNFQTYVFATDNYAIYNDQWGLSHAPSIISTSPLVDMIIGLAPFIDLETVIMYSFNTSRGGSAFGFNDTTVFLGFQLLKQTHKRPWEPDLRFTIGEIFPSGKYDHLNPQKLGADALGLGSYQTMIGANFEKLYPLADGQFLNLYLSLDYQFALSTHVSGLNTYGGGRGTNGRVRPGNNFLADFGLEYTLTQNWASALDVVLTTNQVATFKGFPGLTPMGMLASVGNGNAIRISLAPAIEYNFSAKLGVIAGIWFTVIGKNTPAFVSGVFSVNYYV